MVPPVRIVFDVDGDAHDLQFRQVPLRAWRVVKDETGLTPAELMPQLLKLDVGAVIAAVYLTRSGDDRTTFTRVEASLSSTTQLRFRKVEVDGKDVLDDTDDTVDEADPPTPGS